MTLPINFDNNTAVISSKRGMLSCLSGATFDFAHTRRDIICSFDSVSTYMHAPYALHDASAKPCMLSLFGMLQTILRGICN